MKKIKILYLRLKVVFWLWVYLDLMNRPIQSIEEAIFQSGSIMVVSGDTHIHSMPRGGKIVFAKGYIEIIPEVNR